MQYYEFTKHITPLPAGEGLGVGLCVLSTSYKAYYSPPYGGGAGGGALWGSDGLCGPLALLFLLLSNNLNSYLRTTWVVSNHEHTWLRTYRLNQSLFGSNLHLG